MSDSIVTYDPRTGQPILSPLRGSKRQSGPSLPPEAITRAEAARTLMVNPTELEGEVMHLRAALGTDCRSIGAGDDLVLHGDDVRALANAKLRGEHRRQSPQRRGPFRPRPARSRERFEFTDPGTPSNGTVQVSASKIGKAAERFGMTEQDLTERLIGRAKMQVVDGELLIRNADLSRLVSEGTLHDPAKRQAIDEAVADIEGRKEADPAVARRTEAVADALGVDLGTSSKAKPGNGGTVGAVP